MRTLIRAFVIGFEILRQSLRYGLGRLGALFLPREERKRRVERLRALCLTDFFRNLSATFIKIGQILSSRPDLLPPYIIDELKLLQDHVPPFDYAHVERTFVEDFGRPVGEIFERFEPEPVAAASIAQVHEGWLESGEHVAVKVRRPDIERKMKRDLAVIRALARISDRLPFLKTFRLTPQADAFAKAIYDQLDLTIEARNNERFHKDLKDLSFLHMPVLYRDYCSERVLTMEFWRGKKLEEALKDPPVDRSILAERLFDIYLEMMYGHQFVHADLHPGNVLIDEKGHFILLDTGLVADIPKHYVKRFLRLAIAVTTFDGRILLRTYLEDREGGTPLPPERLAEAEEEAQATFEKIKGKHLHELELGKIFMDIFALLRKYKIWMEPELTMMFVSDITMEGMAKSLDPDFDIFGMMQAKTPKYFERMDWLTPDDLLIRFYRGEDKTADRAD